MRSGLISRAPSAFLWEFSYESGMTVIHAEEIAGETRGDPVDAALAWLARQAYRPDHAIPTLRW